MDVEVVLHSSVPYVYLFRQELVTQCTYSKGWNEKLSQKKLKNSIESLHGKWFNSFRNSDKIWVKSVTMFITLRNTEFSVFQTASELQIHRINHSISRQWKVLCNWNWSFTCRSIRSCKIGEPETIFNCILDFLEPRTSLSASHIHLANVQLQPEFHQD